MGELYTDGSETIQPDRIAGYAYIYIGTQLQISRFSAIDYVRSEVERMTTEIPSEYDGYEVEKGTELAKSIMENYIGAQIL